MCWHSNGLARFIVLRGCVDMALISLAGHFLVFLVYFSRLCRLEKWAILLQDWFFFYALQVNSLKQLLHTYTEVFLDTCLMDLPLTHTPQNFPESAGSGLLLFPLLEMKPSWGKRSRYFMRRCGYLGDWPLPACNHLVEWVKAAFTDKTNFTGKG